MRRVHASGFLDYEALPKLIEDKALSRREHPEFPIFIYNYTDRCQYERLWTPETRQCRGLILDAEGYVIARPFQKFFNLGEHESGAGGLVPFRSNYRAFEKLDGSLGIAYRRPNGKIAIASRGAFMSEQAVWANTWWSDHASGVDIPEGQTWLFEIIYPENRIVVDYEGWSGLKFLAAIDIETGKDVQWPNVFEWPHARAVHYGSRPIDALRMEVGRPDNFEGFVLLYDTGERVKVKLDEYVRLHRLMTTCSSKSIWEILSAGQTLDDIIAHVPDEFYAWVRGWELRLKEEFGEILGEAIYMFETLTVPGDRKATANAYREYKHPSILFRLLDGKDPAPVIWKLIRPEYERPFLVQAQTAA